MLNCKDVADRASALLDNELSFWAVLRIRLHLAMCKGCSRFIGQMQSTDRLTADVAENDTGFQHAADDDHLADILSMLRKEKPKGR